MALKKYSTGKKAMNYNVSDSKMNLAVSYNNNSCDIEKGDKNSREMTDKYEIVKRG